MGSLYMFNSFKLGFDLFCTGLQGPALYFSFFVMTPHSKNKVYNKYRWGSKMQLFVRIKKFVFHIDFHIWLRKILAIIVSSALFYLANIFRMYLQLMLYYRNVPYSILYFPIGAATAFVGGVFFLLMHWIIPELVR